MDVSYSTPEAFDISALTGHNSLLLGAPYVGKSHVLRERKPIDRRVTRLDAALAAPDDSLVVIDEFYDAYQGATDDDRRAFEDWLTRDGGVCLSARPRDLDWLLCSDETPLARTALRQFDATYLLGYRPDDGTERRRAVHRCLEMASDQSSQRLDEADVEAAMDELFAVDGYEFESSPLREQLGIDAYAPTLLPTLVIYFSDQLTEGESTLLTSNIGDVFAGVGENASAGQFYNEVKDACAGLFSRETVSDVTEAVRNPDDAVDSLHTVVSGFGTGGVAAAAGPAGLVAGGSLALYMHLHDNEDESPSREAVFDVLLSEDLSPPAEERLETELDLPPRSIANFRRLVTGDTVERLLQDRDRLEEEFAAVEEAIDSHRAELAAVDEAVTALDDVAVDYAEVQSFVARSIAEATDDIESLGTGLREEEKALLQVGSIDGQPPFHGDGDERILDALSGDSDVVVVRGAHGTGKSTAIYRACSALSNRGYDVRLPNFDSSSRDALRWALTATGDETVVYAHYQRGFAGDNRFRDERDFDRLLAWVEKGYCSTVIIECREELYRTLDGMKSRLGTRGRKRLWERARTIDFERFDDESATRDIARWVIRQLDYDGDPDPIIDEVVATAAGNPEIAKLATRMVLSDPESLSGIGSPEELVWHDIDDILLDDTVTIDGRPIGGLVFEYVAATWEPQTRDVVAMVGNSVDRDDLGTAARYLQGYLGGDVRQRLVGDADEPTTEDASDTNDENGGSGPSGSPSENALSFLVDDDGDGSVGGEAENPGEREAVDLQPEDYWYVQPDIYAEAAFRYGCLEGRIPDRTFEDYLNAVGRTDNEELYAGLAMNLGLVYADALEEGETDLQRKVAVAAQEGLLNALIEDDLDPAIFTTTLLRLLQDGIPVAPEYIETQNQRLANGVRGIDRWLEADQAAVAEEFDQETALLTSAVLMLRNHLEFGSVDQLAGVRETIERAARGQRDTEGDLLISLFAMGIQHTVETVRESPPVAEWVTAIDEEVSESASSEVVHQEPVEFKNDVYESALANIAQWYPDPEVVDPWIDAVFDCGLRSANNEEHGHPPSHILAGLYGGTLGRIASRVRPDAGRAAWFDEVLTRAREATTAGVVDVPPEVFLGRVHNGAIYAYLAFQDDPVTALADGDEPVGALERLAVETYHSELVPSEEFLGGVFTAPLMFEDPETARAMVPPMAARARTLVDDERDTVEDPEAFLLNVFSQAIFNTAFVGPEPHRRIVDAIETEALRTASEEAFLEPGTFLIDVYERTGAKVHLAGPRYEFHDQLLELVYDRILETATEDAHQLSAAKFLQYTYGKLLADLSLRDPDRLASGAQAVESAVDEALAADLYPNPRPKFVGSIYGIALKDVMSEFPDPSTVSRTVDVLFEEGLLAPGAEDADHDTRLYTAFGVVFQKLVIRLPERDPTPFEQWIELLDTRVAEAASNLVSTSTGVALPMAYAELLYRPTWNHADPSTVELWIDRLWRLAVDRATDEGHDIGPDKFLLRLGKKVIVDLSQTPETQGPTEPWLSEYDDRLRSVAESSVVGVSSERFREVMFAGAVDWVAPLDAHETADAAVPIVSQFLVGADSAGVPGFVYRLDDRLADQRGGEVVPGILVDIVCETIATAVEGEGPLGHCAHDTVVERLTAFLAGVVESVVARTGPDGDELSTLGGCVESIEDTTVRGEIIDGVADRLGDSEDNLAQVWLEVVG